MEAKIKMKKWVGGEPWSHGTVTLGNGRAFNFHMKHFENPSDFGIDGGRISKLDIRTAVTDKVVVNYDRGWDVKPRTGDHRAVLNALKAKYN